MANSWQKHHVLAVTFSFIEVFKSLQKVNFVWWLLYNLVAKSRRSFINIDGKKAIILYYIPTVS